MPQIIIQKPTDQPTGQFRLLEEIKENLTSENFNRFRFIVAFAKSGPFLRLDPLIRQWRAGGKTIDAIFGIDEKGTSVQALERSLQLIDHANIVYIRGNYSPTFHPKIYLFQGNSFATGYIGSNNFTVGGLETNFETLVKIGMTLPQDTEILSQFENCWESTFAVSRPITNELIQELKERGLIADESSLRRNIPRRGDYHPDRPEVAFPFIRTLPPSPIPRQSLPPRPLPVVRELEPEQNYTPIVATEALVIQIVPHHNGEIFLSKIAIDQNPEFFGFPFTGQTVPKKANNPSYPQREPDPIVNVRVLDDQEREIEVLERYPLNTVFYDKKSEIRITMPPNIIRTTPPHSIMIMRNALVEAIDYEILILVPGSQLYNTYLDSCNQQMPSGGRVTPRRFGWV